MGHASELLETRRGQAGPAPPGGVWRRVTLRGVEIGSTLRHLPTAGFFLLFALIWNGVTSFILSGVITGPLAPGAGAGGLAFGVVMLVFLVPFVLIGLGAVGAALLALFGTLRVFVEPAEVRVSVGVGPVRRTRRFDPALAVGVGEGESDAEVDGKARTDIVVELRGEGGGGEAFRFGASLRGHRRAWIRDELRRDLTII